MNAPNTNFRYQKTHDGDWEVTMQNHMGGRKAHLPRRLCLCTHEDDAKAIAEAMEINERAEPRKHVAEYWCDDHKRGY